MLQHSFTDQLSRVIQINFPPRRIISLVPSQTELLFDLGLDTEVIGVTKFCTHPDGKVQGKTKVGGTKNLNLDLIRSLQPDIIIANKEENDRSQIETLMQELPVWMSDINDLNNALAMIRAVGQMVDKGEQAALLSQQIAQGFATIQPSAFKLKVAYLIWQKPYMAAGTCTFIDDMLQHCGWENTIKLDRYPEIDITELAYADVIMLSSEPYPFKQKHVDAFTKQCPRSKVILVDGEMFSWYGSRLLKAVPYFKKLMAQLNNDLI
jgi:ABC-type Fe3+-hydroxamate transport system substrate-binding protein